MAVFGYVRLSRADGEESRFGLAAQRHAISVGVSARGWVLNDVIEDNGWSAKDLRRPGLQELLGRLVAGDALVVAKLDRLSRSLQDFCGLVAQSKRDGWSLVALDVNVDTSSAVGAMVANIMASFAQFERDMISQRTKEALAVKRAAGWVPGPERRVSAEAEARMRELRASGLPIRLVTAALNREGFRSPTGKAWGPSSVQMVLSRA